MLKRVIVSEDILIAVVGNFYSRGTVAIRSMQDYEINIAMATLIKGAYDKEEALRKSYDIKNDIEDDLPVYVLALIGEHIDIPDLENMTPREWLYRNSRNIIPEPEGLDESPYPMHVEEIKIAIADKGDKGGYFEVIADEESIKDSITVLKNWGLPVK